MCVMGTRTSGAGREKAKSPLKKRAARGSVVDWIPRREACELLQVSKTTIRSWEGKRLRATSRTTSDGTIRWFYHRDDVERARLDRLGPRQWEIERHVLTSLAEGRRPFEIIHEVTHVTLADVERIRDHDARLSGACIVEAECVRELRQLLDLETVNGRMLVLHVRALVERVERLAAMRLRRSAPPESAANGSG